MLTQKSIVPGPGMARDPMVKVRVLSPMRSGGKEYAVGETLSMLLSDAQYAAKSITPPQVEIL
jgi:hypothetical protein